MLKKQLHHWWHIRVGS